MRLHSERWPTERPPPTTASLLSISSSKGLLAAAGPSSLILATTESVRKAYVSDAQEENGAKSFSPQSTIPIPRVNQVAFSSDGSCLVIAAEEGGGLAVYDVQQLQQGQQQSAFQMPTNGTSLRALVPNPAPEFSHIFALVLSTGQLMLANLKDRQMISGGAGQVFRKGVSCVSWSTKGKQLVAGLADGTAAQYDHQGNMKAQIPRPPQITDSMPITSMFWIANDDFFTVHTPVSADINDSTYHIIHRDKASGAFQASKFASDPVPAFGTRLPAHQFISRLKGLPPNLDDVLVMSSTGGTDVGVFTRPIAALAPNTPVNTYLTTSMANDSARAQMPMSSDGMGDTSPIGMALDLSATEHVKRPIPSIEEIDETSSPLPAIMILDNEGRLSTWWIASTEAIKQKLPYPGLTSVQSQATPSMQSTPFGQTNTPSTASSSMPPPPTPGFGASAFGQPAKPAFGATSAPGFGGTSSMAKSSSPWGTPSQAPSAFGKPSFGSSTPFGTPAAGGGFGSTGALGSKSSPWGQQSPTTQQQTSTPAFGQTSTPFGGANGSSGFAKLGSPGPSPFGASQQSSDKPVASPFGSFGATNAAQSDSKTGASPFAAFGTNKPAASPFASTGADRNKTSPFAAFGQQNKSAGLTPQPSFGGETVSLGSTTGGSFGAPSSFGGISSFGTLAQKQSSSLSQEATMADDDAMEENATQKPAEKPSGFSGFKLGSTFQGDGTAKDDGPKPKTPAASLFGSGFGDALGGTAKEPVTPVKQEPDTNEPRLAEISTTPASPPRSTQTPSAQTPTTPAPQPEAAPLPPDFTTTPAQPPAEAIDAPLPPDFTKPAPKETTEAKKTDDVPPLPPSFLTSKPRESVVDDTEPIAGSPPVDLGAGSPELSPHESDNDAPEASDEEEEEAEGDEDERNSEEWEEESGADEVDEDQTPQPSKKTSATPASSAFGSRLSFPSNAPDTEKSTKSSLFSTTPAGLPKGPMFAPPVKDSPRSPSPIRSISTPARPPSRPSVLPAVSTTHSRTHSRQPSRPTSALQVQKHPPPPAQSATPDLEDDEDDRIRSILASAIEPSKTLDPFIAHQDYVGHDTRPGITGQVENVYRDINSMIDTLGLNARTLEAFVLGQTELRQSSSRDINDIDDAEDWTLVEHADLDALESQLLCSIDKAKITSIPAKMTDLNTLHASAVGLKSKIAETRRNLSTHTDPAKQTAQRNAPLDTETEIQQSSLRQAVSKAQTLLHETEELLSLLRADLASSPTKAKDGRTGPTVEAVTNTILKMTAMIETKSGDVDVLESQIRRLPGGLAGLSLDDNGFGEEDMLRSSSSLRSSISNRPNTRRGLPGSRSMNALMATPPTSSRGNRRSMILGREDLGMSGMLGSRFRTPPQRSANGSSPLDGALLGQSARGSARKKMSDVTREEVREYNARRAQRRSVLDALKGVVERRGARVVQCGT